MTEQQPDPPIWYEAMIKALVDAQTRSAAGHQAIARHCRVMADHLIVVAEQHEALAVAVPDGDQAAADLGTATDRHHLNNLRTVVLGEQALAKANESQLARLAADLVELNARVQVLAVRLASELPAALSAPAPSYDPDDPDLRDHGHDEMGMP